MDRHEAVATLLMGAAYADDELDGRELVEVEKLLRRVTGDVELDPRLAQCLNAFEPASFDVGQVASVLSTESVAAKRKILELVVAVHDADQQWDFAEDAYVRSVGEALGLPESEYRDFVIEDVHIESAGFVVLPPPPPVIAPGEE